MNTTFEQITFIRPEQKQEEISTLYEAIQLFKISGFTYTEDNVNILENDIYWEHHKPGRDAVRTNTGCCAADTNWLNYILRELCRSTQHFLLKTYIAG